MKKKGKLETDDIQTLAEKFIYSDDYSAFVCLWKQTSETIRKYIFDYLSGIQCARKQSLLEDIYNKTMGDIFDNAKDYYDSTKSKFLTWACGVARRNCLSVLSPYNKNRFYIVDADVDDIENNNINEENSHYRLEKPEEEKIYNYTINGCDRTSNYEELIEDITNCVKSCIYYIEDSSKSKRPNREIFKKLYLENKYMHDVATELSIEEHAVRNAVTYCRKNILKIFMDKYSDLYRVIKEERIFSLNK